MCVKFVILSLGDHFWCRRVREPVSFGTVSVLGHCNNSCLLTFKSHAQLFRAWVLEVSRWQCPQTDTFPKVGLSPYVVFSIYLVMLWKAIIIEYCEDKSFVKGFTVWNLKWKIRMFLLHKKDQVVSLYLFEGECLIKKGVKSFSVNLSFEFSFFVWH